MGETSCDAASAEYSYSKINLPVANYSSELCQ